MFVVEIEFFYILFKIFTASEDGNLPKNEGVGGNVVKCRPLLVLDRVLESPDRRCPFNHDWKDAIGIFTENPTIELEQFGAEAMTGD